MVKATFACNKTTTGVLYHPVRACSAISAASLYFLPYLTTFNYLKVSVLILNTSGYYHSAECAERWSQSSNGDGHSDDFNVFLSVLKNTSNDVLK